MPRAVWTGTLSFGLVTIPVALFPATEPKDVRSHLTDSRGRRVRYRRFVSAEEPLAEPFGAPEPPADAVAQSEAEPRGEPMPTTSEREVAYEDLMRGYETDEGQVVLLSREEVEEVRPQRSRTIEIEDFVALADIDPVYFEKSYHLAPRSGGERPYVLLLSAMERAGRVGIGRFVLRTKPHLVAIRPADGVLGLETMFFSDEVRSGRELVRSVDGIEPTAASGPALEELMAALKASVEAAKGTKRTSRARKRKPA